VILSTNTFCSAANVVMHLGARPVFVDIEPDTLNLNLDQVESVLDEHTSAIMPVHFAGLPVNKERLDGLASRLGIKVVEDAAHSLPARFDDGSLVGSGTRLTAFSFYATKNLTTGEGGMLTGAEEEIARVRSLAIHGMSKDSWRRYGSGGSWRYDVTCPGYKYNMTDPHAAVGLVQLDRLSAMYRRRTEVVAAYAQALAGYSEVILPPGIGKEGHAWHLFVIQLVLDRLTISRDEFIGEMARRGVSCSVHFIPLHLQPAYKHVVAGLRGSFPVADSYFAGCVSLPLHPHLSDEDVNQITAAVADIVESYRA
jgi:dTDP-4-amino-4,6-dideoxygalactose transaminase